MDEQREREIRAAWAVARWVLHNWSDNRVLRVRPPGFDYADPVEFRCNGEVEQPEDGPGSFARIVAEGLVVAEVGVHDKG